MSVLRSGGQCSVPRFYSRCVQFLEGFRGYAFMGKVGAIAQADTSSVFLWCLDIPPSEDDSVYSTVQSAERGASFHHQKIKQRNSRSQIFLTSRSLCEFLFHCSVSLPAVRIPAVSSLRCSTAVQERLLWFHRLTTSLNTTNTLAGDPTSFVPRGNCYGNQGRDEFDNT